MSADPTNTPLLEALDLRKIYPGVEAVRGVSFEVGAGEIVGLLGPNGAGKSTILRMLAAILSPTSGTARVCGFDTATHPLDVKRSLGFLSGDTALYGRLTPREVMQYFGRLQGIGDGRIADATERLIAELDMTDFADRRCETLSSGQQQKANIARTLLHDPPVLILDEPTTALDVISGRFILEAIRRAKGDGRAVLFSTHIMSEAEYLCDRILLLHRGTILDRGSMAELTERVGLENLTAIFLHYVNQVEKGNGGPTSA